MSRRAERVLEIVLLVLILGSAGWLRLRDLDRFIASDEVRWTCRSINFHAALVEQRWRDTFQVGHPGVLTMWLGALALPLEQTGPWRELCVRTDGGQDFAKLDDPGNEGLMQGLAPLLFTARRGVAVGTLVLLAGLYLLLRRRVGPWPALGGMALVALDPFLLAHSKVLHVDAVVSLLAVMALAALPPRPPDNGGGGLEAKRGWGLGLVLAGVFTGLAMLNKASGLVLGPFVVVWGVWTGWRTRRWREVARGLLVWGVVAAAVYGLVWPAMWVNPVGTVAGVLAKADAEGTEPHSGGNFFLGQPVDDPGPLFYPVAGAFRLTPWALLALALAVAFALGWPRRPADEAEGWAAARGLVRVLLAWAVFFALFMTIGPKKFDRYLLPALVAVNAAAGVAVVELARGVVPRWIGTADARISRLGTDRGVWRTVAGAAAVGVLVGLQVVAAVRVLPYPLAYYNPLLGGARVAERVILVGWGEGYDLAAEYLNGLPGAAERVVSARGVANFAPLFAGRTRSAEGYEPGRTDEVVLYVSQLQRRRNEDLLGDYDQPGVEPLFVGRIAGIDYVKVYANATVAPLHAALAELTRPGDVLVTGGETVLAREYDGPLALVRYWGHWGGPEMTEALGKDFPAGWQRAWVVRYPGYDPEVALQVLEGVAERGPTVAVMGGQVELTPFTRRAP
jgi:4-amino-4-deoxy-L-arabinose transferase-like glycosyltransferase